MPATGDAMAESQPFRAAISGDEPPDLAVALEELNCVEAAAREDGCPVPSGAALASAELMLRRLHGHAPLPYMVSSA